MPTSATSTSATGRRPSRVRSTGSTRTRAKRAIGRGGAAAVPAARCGGTWVGSLDTSNQKERSTMATHDDPDRRRSAEESAERRHPARPEQTDEGYATGVEHKPDTPEEELEPDFARGVAETDPDTKGRFSTGVEQTPDSPEKEREGRFSDTN